MATITRICATVYLLLNTLRNMVLPKLPSNIKPTGSTFIYRWKRRFDGSIDSLCDLSRRSHHHPSHTPEKIKLIFNMRKRNPDTGLVIFWFKLIQRSYSRSIPGLYCFLKKQGIMVLHPPNPKYIPKPYGQMLHLGQRI